MGQKILEKYVLRVRNKYISNIIYLHVYVWSLVELYTYWRAETSKALARIKETEDNVWTTPSDAKRTRRPRRLELHRHAANHRAEYLHTKIDYRSVARSRAFIASRHVEPTFPFVITSDVIEIMDSRWVTRAGGARSSITHRDSYKGHPVDRLWKLKRSQKTRVCRTCQSPVPIT